MAHVKTFENVTVGDVLAGPDGPVTVTDVYDLHLPKDCFELVTEKGDTVVVSGSHLFYVITDDALSKHRKRCREAKRVLKDIGSECEEMLTYMAQRTVPVMERAVSIDYMADYIGDSDEMKAVLRRIARSIGPVIEEHQTRVDLFDDAVYTVDEYLYDSKLFAQQVLGLYAPRRYRKRYPVLVGEVMNAYELSTIYPQADLPEVKMDLPEAVSVGRREVLAE